MSYLHQPHYLTDEQHDALHAIAVTMKSSGYTPQDVARELELQCAKMNVEYHPDGLQIVESVFDGRFNSSEWIQNYPRHQEVVVGPAGAADTKLDTELAVDATPTNVVPPDVTMPDATATTVEPTPHLVEVDTDTLDSPTPSPSAANPPLPLPIVPASEPTTVVPPEKI